MHIGAALDLEDIIKLLITCSGICKLLVVLVLLLIVLLLSRIATASHAHLDYYCQA